MLQPKKLQKYEMQDSFGLMENDNTTVVAVVGSPADFYIFMRDASDKFSARIPSLNKYHELKRQLGADKEKFFLDCVDLMNKYPKNGVI